MKSANKIYSLLLAIMLMVLPTASVLANADNSLVIENTGLTTHSFEVYQIFKGDVSVKDGVHTLSNVKWGDDVKNKNGDATEEAEKLKTKKDALDFVESIKKDLENPLMQDVEPGEFYRFDNLEAGYYLIKDTEKSQSDKKEEDQAYTLNILKIVGNVVAKTKLDVPTVEKFVKDVNDTRPTDYEDWGKVADHDIGDDVQFKLEGTLPTNYVKYTKYRYAFYDELSKGLSLKEKSIKVKIDDEVVDANRYKIDILAHKLIVTFADLKQVKEVKINKDSIITVEYEATLNENAVVGKPGNPNEVYLEYSNNPNIGKKASTGVTPKDKVVVFTYKVEINKVDQDKNPLKGAEFTLEKYIYTPKTENVEWKKIDKVEVKDETKFIFSGLDDGNYRLRETKTPEGYNTIEEIQFTIESKFNDDLELSEINGISFGDIMITMTPDKEKGSLTADVINKRGAKLPETGGSGTTVLYCIGLTLIIGGVVVLLSSKKSVKEI